MADQMRRNQHTGKTHCIHGHALDGGNVKVDRRGWRRCLTCQDAAQARSRARYIHVQVGPRCDGKRARVLRDPVP